MATFQFNTGAGSNGQVDQSKTDLISRNRDSANYESQFATVHVVDSDFNEASSIWAAINQAGLRSLAYKDGKSFLATYQPADVGCIVLELNLPDMSGLDLQARLAARGIIAPLIFITGAADIPSVVKAMRAGALNVLEKPVEPQVLLDQLKLAIESDARRRKTIEGIDQLSTRELEVMKLLLEARSTKEVAKEMGISPKTVEKHRANLLAKLLCDNVTELM